MSRLDSRWESHPYTFVEEGRTTATNYYLRLAKETLLGDFLLYVCHDIRLDLFKDNIPKSWQKNYTTYFIAFAPIFYPYSAACLHRGTEYWFMERNNVNSWENTWVKVRKNSNKNTSSFLNQMVWLIGHNSAQKLSLSSTWTLKSRSTSKPMLHALENWCAWLIGHLKEFFPELYMTSADEFYLSIYSTRNISRIPFLKCQ